QDPADRTRAGEGSGQSGRPGNRANITARRHAKSPHAVQVRGLRGNTNEALTPSPDRAPFTEFGRSGQGLLRRQGSSALLAAGYLEALSFAKVAIASCTVVMNCAGKMMVEFFSTEISTMVCRVRSCSATGCCAMMSAAWPSRTAA